jgi:glycosyltransferase involved in cell wall biosynthesis
MLISPAVDEGVPMTIPEAMLCGRPALATSVGGAPDWITAESNGFLCPSASVDLLTAALSHAWALRAKWREMGERAAKDATERYRPMDFRQLVSPLLGSSS